MQRVGTYVRKSLAKFPTARSILLLSRCIHLVQYREVIIILDIQGTHAEKRSLYSPRASRRTNLTPVDLIFPSRRAHAHAHARTHAQARARLHKGSVRRIARGDLYPLRRSPRGNWRSSTAHGR